MSEASPLGWPASDRRPLEAVAQADPAVRPDPVGWMVPRETPKD